MTPPDDVGRRVREFVRAAMAHAADHADPNDLTGLSEGFEAGVQRRAGEAGLLGPGHPGDGAGRSAHEQAVFDFEVARADAPLIDTALTLAGHPLRHYGSPEQREHFLPRMERGEILICVAYTERGAGSDLRALESTAVRDGDGYRLTGHKTLVTGAHKSGWALTIARTDESPRAMTMFLVDLTLPGVTVARRPTMNGWTLDEIVFDDVALGAGAVIGEPGKGWRQLVAAVQEERSGTFYLGFARHALDLFAQHLGPDADVLAREALGGLEADYVAGTLLAARALREPGLGSMAKVFATELLQRIAQAATETAGHAGLVHAPLFSPAPPYAAGGGRFAWEYLERVHATIGAGTNDLLRDGIAEAGLGLPRAGASAPEGTPRRPAIESVSDVLALCATGPGYDRAWWREQLATGALGGGSFRDLTVAIGALAAAATPSPVHTALVQSGSALRLLGGEETRLGSLRAGEHGYAFCLTEPSGGYRRDDVATTASGGRLTGVKCFVPYAAAADALLVVARTEDGHGVFAVDRDAPGVTLEPLPTLGLDRQCVVRLESVRGERLGPPGDAWPVVTAMLARASVAAAADQLGAARAALDHTVAHVLERQVFGAPLGTYQSVKHRCADALIDLTVAEEIVVWAAGVIDDGGDEALAGAVAKAAVSERCRRVSALAHQLAGGEGIYADQPLHLWYRRIKATEPVGGSPRTARATIAASFLH